MLPPIPIQSNVPAATPVRRKRGPSLSRRTGQRGYVYQAGNPGQWNPIVSAYGRFWADTPDGRKQKTINIGVCRTRSIAKQKLFEYLESTGVNSKEIFTANTCPAVTFRQQASCWVSSLATRRRKPVKPATIRGWRSALNQWLLPNLGGLPLSDVGNGALKALVEKMAQAGLTAKTIVNYCAAVKMVVASAVTDDGEQIYPRKWNHDFCGIPIVDPTKQRRPTLTAEQVSAIVSNAKGRYQVLLVLLAGTGLRIGEALALKTTNLDPDCRVIHVRRSIWNGKEQSPKTANAVRSVDVPESLVSLLKEYASDKAGYLFASKSGRPLIQRNVHRTLQRLAGWAGFHAFRRFRIAILRRAHVPEDLLRFWVGHAATNVTDLYAAQLRGDTQFRQEWVERAGLGFQLGYVGIKNAVPIELVKVA